MPKFAIRHAMDTSNIVQGVLSAKLDGTLVAYEPGTRERAPFIVAEALALGHPLGYVKAMMRNHTFEELACDPQTLAAIEAAEPPAPQPSRRGRSRRGAFSPEEMMSNGGAHHILADDSPLPAALTPPTSPTAPAGDLEPSWVLDRLVEVSRERRGSVEEFISAVHHVVDSLVTDDVLVVAFPLVVGRVGCPVWERFRYLVKGEWEGTLDVFDASSAEIAEALALPVDVVEQYPTAGVGAILIRTAEELGRTADSELPGLYTLLQAWLDTYELPGSGLRAYRVQPAGRERHFEDWLVQNLPVLSDHDYPVRLADPSRDGMPGRQVAVHGRRSIADLVGVLTADTPEMRKSDLLVVENKTTAVGPEVADQLARYVDLLRATTKRPVHGLVIADGLTVDAGRAIAERGFGYLSLAQIGYRDHLRASAAPTTWDPDGTAVAYPGGLLDGSFLEDPTTA